MFRIKSLIRCSLRYSPLLKKLRPREVRNISRYLFTDKKRPEDKNKKLEEPLTSIGNDKEMDLKEEPKIKTDEAFQNIKDYENESNAKNDNKKDLKDENINKYDNENKNDNDNDNKNDNDNDKNNKDNKEDPNGDKDSEENPFMKWLFEQMNISTWSTLKKQIFASTVISLSLLYIFKGQIEYMMINRIDEKEFWTQLDMANVKKLQVSFIRSLGLLLLEKLTIDMQLLLSNKVMKQSLTFMILKVF